ncbi:MAG: dTMP kinase [Alteromonadaceae bacterium]|jgi:dTMP kinase
MDKARFIVIEGLEGAGKSTAIEVVKAFLQSKNLAYITTREPGGTPLAEKMRAIVKEVHDEALTPEAELLLMYAARVQLIENVILKALKQNQWVIGDRHDLSSRAYQGGGRQIDSALIDGIRHAVLKGFTPDLTLYLDLDPKIGLARAAARGELDRIEQEPLGFFQRTREKYLQIAHEDDTIKIIDASLDMPAVHRQINQALTQWYEAL